MLNFLQYRIPNKRGLVECPQWHTKIVYRQRPNPASQNLYQDMNIRNLPNENHLTLQRINLYLSLRGNKEEASKHVESTPHLHRKTESYHPQTKDTRHKPLHPVYHQP